MQGYFTRDTCIIQCCCQKRVMLISLKQVLFYVSVM